MTAAPVHLPAETPLDVMHNMICIVELLSSSDMRCYLVSEDSGTQAGTYHF